MTRRCCYCEVEFGIKLEKGDRVSHGICRRHVIKQYIENGLEDKLAEIDAAKDEDFCADLSQVYDG